MIQKKLHLDLYRQYIIGDKMFFCVWGVVIKN
jgi:hypothetical protein